MPASRPSPAAAPLASEPPADATRVRYGVLGLVCSLAMITYLDRACMAMAVPLFVQDLGLHSAADMKWALFAFNLAYALFEVPTGWLGDRFGPRRVLLRIVLWWSLFTGLTGLVGLPLGPVTLGMTSLIVIRFLFGIGEAGAFPNITRALHNWFPFQQRGFTQGAVWMSGRLIGGLTPLIWTVLVEGVRSQGGATWLPPLISWRATFWLFAILGVAWCIVFALWFRNRPEEKPAVNAAELAWIRGGRSHASDAGHANVPWGRILRSRNLWLLCLMYACQSYGWYFYMTYLPSFMEMQYQVERASTLGAIYKGGPLWLGALGCLLGGLLTDGFIRRTGNHRLGRKIFGALGHGLTAVCFLLCPWMPSAFTFFVVISLSGFFTDLTMGSSWASCQDIGRRYAAIVAGFMNMIGNLGGALCPALTGIILDLALSRHASGLGVADVRGLSEAQTAAGLLAGYHTSFYLFSAVFVVGTLCWIFMDPTKAVAEE